LNRFGLILSKFTKSYWIMSMNNPCLRCIISFLCLSILVAATALSEESMQGPRDSLDSKAKPWITAPSGFRTAFPDPWDQVSGPVIDLSPIVVSPLVTNNDLLIESIARDPTPFLTAAGWREQMNYRSELDQYLNLFTIPFFGIAQEAIASMYAQDARLGEKLETLELIIKTRASHQPSVRDAYLQDRYDLMRMKRHALFGSSWALPEIGK
jgi:hypothetical protein